MIIIFTIFIAVLCLVLSSLAYTNDAIYHCSYALRVSHVTGGLAWSTPTFLLQPPVPEDKELCFTVESTPTQFASKLTEFGSTNSGKL